jgi:hydrogenase maturation protease
LGAGTVLAPAVVVGLGNEIAGDDGAGIHAARILEDELADDPEIDVVALPWGGLALLEVLRDRRRAALIDCLVSGEHPAGSVVRLEESDFRGSVRLNSFHDISFPAAIALGRELGWRLPDEIAIWGIEAAEADVFTEALTAPVAAAVHEVVHAVARFLRNRDGPPPNRME